MWYYPYGDGNGRGRSVRRILKPSGALLFSAFSGMDLFEVSWKLFVFQKNRVEKMGVSGNRVIFDCAAFIWHSSKYLLKKYLHKHLKCDKLFLG